MQQDKKKELYKNYIQTAPVQYLNQKGILEKSGYYISLWGKKALINGGKKALNASGEIILTSLEKSNIHSKINIFTGECSTENIRKIVVEMGKWGADVAIAVGGGKVLDATKAAAFEYGIPVVCIPTIASTCAATTAISIIYDSTGAFQHVIYLPGNPNLVLVDPAIIANAPVLYLQSGIFDSLAKWYEGRVVFKGISEPDIFTRAAILLAEMLHNQMKELAIKAVNLVNRQIVAKELINVIDLNIYLTGVIQSLGQATIRGGVAHAVHNGFTFLEKSHTIPHGINVGYGIIVQLFLEKRSINEIREVVLFFRNLGFEPTLKELGLACSRDEILMVAEKAAADPYIGKMPFSIEAYMIANAIEEVEKLVPKL